MPAAGSTRTKINSCTVDTAHARRVRLENMPTMAELVGNQLITRVPASEKQTSTAVSKSASFRRLLRKSRYKCCRRVVNSRKGSAAVQCR